MSKPMTPEARAEVRFPLAEDEPDFDNVLRQRGYFTAIREQVEPLEAKVIEQSNALADAYDTMMSYREEIDGKSAEVAKLRALVQEAWPYMQHKAGCRAISFANSMLSHAPISQRTCTCGFDKLRASLAKSLKEQGFVPTNTEDK